MDQAQHVDFGTEPLSKCNTRLERDNELENAQDSCLETLLHVMTNSFLIFCMHQCFKNLLMHLNRL